MPVIDICASCGEEDVELCDNCDMCESCCGCTEDDIKDNTEDDAYLNEPVTPSNLVKALMADLSIDETAARELMVKHQSLLDTGVRLHSFTYYVANEIVQLEKPDGT